MSDKDEFYSDWDIAAVAIAWCLGVVLCSPILIPVWVIGKLIKATITDREEHDAETQ